METFFALILDRDFNSSSTALTLVRKAKKREDLENIESFSPNGHFPAVQRSSFDTTLIQQQPLVNRFTGRMNGAAIYLLEPR
jgi:hypothetical protein